MAKASLFRLTNEEAWNLLEGLRWPNGPVCATCGSTNVVAMKGKTCRTGLKRCRDCRKQFTATVNTIFESSHIPLENWMFAFAAMCSAKKGISALQLQRQLELGSYRTAWFMCHRIRHAMKTNSFDPLVGAVEVDETYVGGKPRKGTGEVNKRGRGTKKVPVVALVERSGRVRSRVITDVTAKTLKSAIRDNVSREATIITDELSSYKGIGKEFEGGHKTVNHGEGEYARNDGTNTNTVESYFALIKRGVYGNFHHVSRQHLQRYCDEFSFRWDHRSASDMERTVTALRQSEGKRLMYS